MINNGLNEGTQLPYIRRAKQLGYAVLILNTNDNYRDNRYIPVWHFSFQFVILHLHSEWARVLISLFCEYVACMNTYESFVLFFLLEPVLFEHVGKFFS